MLKIKIVSVGKIKEKSLKSLIDEYVKRLGRYAKTEMVELSDLPVPDNPSAGEITAVIEKENRNYKTYFTSCNGCSNVH